MKQLCLIVLFPATVWSANLPADDAVSFDKNVYRVLRRACFECHGAERQEADLRLDNRASLAESGAVVGGRPAESELLRRISLPKGHDDVMPVVGDPLSAKEVAAIRRWILEGAIWPDDFSSGRHWAYVPPAKAAVKESAGENWGRNEIDHFVLLRLRKEGMAPSAEADAATLVRRLYFDLIGLPPSPEVVNRFTHNASDAAYEGLVDDLLARPQFGERWARSWLDLARYADSHGFQRDNFREIWAYRDWVIRAMNQDMPFDRFTIEQIAGDLLPDATETQRIATGFHRCTPTNVEAGSIPEETRVEQIIDRVNTTGAVWLGTTLECAQCHDHKYDPFTQKDYYRLFAYYNNTQAEADRANPKQPSSIKFLGPQMNISNAARDAKRKRLAAQKASLVEQRAKREKELVSSLKRWAVDFATAARESPQIHPLEVVAFQSTGATDTHEILDDRSVLVTGSDPPPTDVYTVKVSGVPDGTRAFQLDVLTHDSLPGKGPGRGDAKKTNFVLNEVSCTGPNGEIAFQSATADFSQKNWDVNGAISDKPKTGWAIAPEFGKPHWARFVLKSPLHINSKDVVQFTLRHDYGGARSIGRFRLSAVTGNLSAETIPAMVVAAVKKPIKSWSKADHASVKKYRQQIDVTTAELDRQITQIDKELSALQEDTTLVMVELPEPRESYIFDRGDYRNHGDTVDCGTPEALHPMPDGPPTRLTLARWLISRDNPLVARVTVNRWWMEIFGRGIVSTPEDFGLKGEFPSHPELLDWLAVELMDNGWSRKKLLKTIVMSATYRQSSFLTEELAARDDQNELLARGARLRMDAEMIRDNILSAAGLLSLKQFGPSIRPYQPAGIWSKVGGTSYPYKVSAGEDQYRRGIYVVLKRGAPYPSFVNFDASARLACTVKRSRTNTPLQALTLLNDPVYVEAAEAMARRILTQKSLVNDVDRMTFAFQLVTARKPNSTERGVLMDLFETERSVNRERDVTGENLPEGATPVDFAAWKSVATALINLHETITRN